MGNAQFVALDVTKRGRLGLRQSRFTVETFGRLDILINNAAIYSRTNIVDTDIEEWRRIMDINMTGVFLGTKHAVPAMRDTGGGSIINISSTAGLVGSARGSAYGASKGGVRLFTKYAAIQHALRRDQGELNSPWPD